MRKKNKYVIIHERPVTPERTGRFLGNRVHPGFSAATCWLEKHCPKDAEDIDGNFELICVNHEKLTAIFAEELEARLPDGPDKELLLSMLSSLTQGHACLRMPINDRREIHRRRCQSKADREKARLQKAEKQACSRFEASKEFRES